MHPHSYLAHSYLAHGYLARRPWLTGPRQSRVPARAAYQRGGTAAYQRSISPSPPQSTAPHVRVYLTTADLGAHLTRQPDLAFAAPLGRRLAMTIRIDDGTTYQQMDGFGAALTDTSAWLLETRLTPAARDAAMRALFSPKEGIGLSVLRVPIGASDFTHDAVSYSYDDVGYGRADPALAAFSIAHDNSYILPLLQEALRLNPQLKIIASLWSPPAWMKLNESAANARHDGQLRASSYAPLAAYFVKFIRAYQAHGIPIYAVSPQNEPSQPTDYPGMELPPANEASFVRDYLGPALAAAGLDTRILAYDYNWAVGGDESYPAAVLSDGGARRYIAGVAYHCYQGSPAAMTRLHGRYPDVAIYETECSSGIAPGPPAELTIAAARNWSRTVMLWNLALDARGGPRQGNGCRGCRSPIVVGDNGTVTYTADFAQLGQASAFVQPGARRIASNSFIAAYGAGYGSRYGVDTIDDVAFVNPDGTIALLVYNGAARAETFAVQWHGRAFTDTLPAGAAVTFTWTGRSVGANALALAG